MVDCHVSTVFTASTRQVTAFCRGCGRWYLPSERPAPATFTSRDTVFCYYFLPSCFSSLFLSTHLLFHSHSLFHFSHHLASLCSSPCFTLLITSSFLCSYLTHPFPSTLGDASVTTTNLLEPSTSSSKLTSAMWFLLLSMLALALGALANFEEQCTKMANVDLTYPSVVVNFARYLPAGATVDPKGEGVNETCLLSSPPAPPGAHNPAVSRNVCRIGLKVSTSPTSSVTMEAWFPEQWEGNFLQMGNPGMGGCECDT
jgi:hypothetical protein